MLIDEKTLRQSTNAQVIATMMLIDEVRQLKEMLGVQSNLVFLDKTEKQESFIAEPVAKVKQTRKKRVNK